ncbi:MAG TPA: hypothetical protein HPP77_08420 [Candidatus Hydrogenedentes bacterium]|nr:hypothetical protein [Candidatus Hydrogenedentota bacterium]
MDVKALALVGVVAVVVTTGVVLLGLGKWKVQHFLALLIPCVLILPILSCGNLYKTARIQGWFPGATESKVTITQKWHEKRRVRYGKMDCYFISWAQGDAQDAPGLHGRLNPEAWHEVQPGDIIDVYHIPGDPSPYLRNGIGTSTSGFVFDVVLFVIALGIVAVLIGGIINADFREFLKDLVLRAAERG